MSKAKASKIDSQLKSSLAQLKKLGLYNPKSPRKAPTRYAKDLVKQFTKLGVLGTKPTSEVIKVPKNVAKELQGQFRTKTNKKGAVAIVPKSAGMKATYSKWAGTIVRKAGSYTLIPYADKNVLLKPGELPQLKKGDKWAVRIGNSFRIFKTVDELRKAQNEYRPGSTTLWQFPYISIKKK